MVERDFKSANSEGYKVGGILERLKEFSLFESKTQEMERKYPNACKLVKAELAVMLENFDDIPDLGPTLKETSFSEMVEIKPTDLSETTLKYLEDWESLEFGLNTPNLKPTILRRIILADYSFIKDFKANDKYMMALGELGMSLEEYVNSCQLFIEDAVKEISLFRATDHRVLINHILAKDERWKSQFETGTSDGLLRPSHRSKKENEYFGFPDYASDEAKTKDESSSYHVSKRPIYGYLTTDENGIFNSLGTHPPYNSMAGYGKVHCKIKKSKSSESTFIFGDSLDDPIAFSPVMKPHYLSLPLKPTFMESNPVGILEKMYDDQGSRVKKRKKIDVPTLYKVNNSDYKYIELQLHDGLSTADIESIHVSRGNGLDHFDIDKISLAVMKYNLKHPESPIEFVRY